MKGRKILPVFLALISTIGCTGTTSSSNTSSTYWKRDDYKQYERYIYEEADKYNNFIRLFDYQTLREYAKVSLFKKGINNILSLNPQSRVEEDENDDYNIYYDSTNGMLTKVAVYEHYHIYEESFGYYLGFDKTADGGDTGYSFQLTSLLNANVNDFTDFEIETLQISSTTYFLTLSTSNDVLGYICLYHMNEEKLNYAYDYIKRNLTLMSNKD